VRFSARFVVSEVEADLVDVTSFGGDRDVLLGSLTVTMVQGENRVQMDWSRRASLPTVGDVCEVAVRSLDEEG